MTAGVAWGRGFSRAALVFSAYLVGFLALDFATEGIKGSLSVSLWFPPVGLTMALLLAFGWRWARAVAPVFLLHLVLFRGGLSYPPLLLLAIPVLYAFLYGGAAFVLLRVARIDPRLLRMRDVAWFVGVTCLLAPLSVAAVSVSGFVLGGYSPAGDLWVDLLGFWAGDATGIAVVAPLLLVALRRFPSLRSAASAPVEGFRLPTREELPEATLQALGLVLALAAAYGAARGAALDYAYLAFAPVVWIALRGGLERAVVALVVVNVAVVVLVGDSPVAPPGAPSPVRLQFGLMALTLVGLLLGAQRSEQRRSEARLRQSEERYRALMEGSVEAIYVYDAESKRVLESNEAFREMTGYSGEELRGMEIYEFIAHEKEDIDRRIRRSLEVGGRHLGERDYRRKDGSLVVVETSSSVLPYGDKVAICAVSRDVTELKEAREELERSERRFRSLIQHAPDAITVLAPDSTVLYDSPAVEHLLGYTPEERVGKKGFGWVHPDDADLARRTLTEVLENPGVRMPVEYRLRRKDGAWLHFEAARTNLIEDPAVGGIVLNYRDVTGRKEAEAGLRESRDLLRAVMEGTTDAVYVKDEEGRYLMINPAGAEMLGRTVEDVLGEDDRALFEAPDAEGVIAEDREILASGETKTYEERKEALAEASPDVARTYLTTRGPYRDRSGEPVGVFGVSRDITERKRLEEEAREAEAHQRRRAWELEVLHRVRTAVSAELDLGRIYEAVVEAVAETFGYTLVSAYLLEGEGDNRELVLGHQVGYGSVLGRIPLDRGVMARVARTGEPVLLEDVRSDPDFLEAEPGIASEVCVPLLDGEETVGTLNVESTGGERLGADDLRLMEEVGYHVGTAVGRARLHGRVGAAERRFRTLVENASDLIAIVDAGGRALYLSPAFREVRGYAPEEQLGRYAFEDVHPDDVEAAREAYAALLADPSLRPTLEFRVRHADGSFRHLEAIGANLLDDPAVGGIVVNARDVTGRRRAEEALKASEERFRGAFEGASVGVALVDLDNRYLRVNSALCEMLGYEEGELLSKRTFDITHPEDQEKSHARPGRMLAEGGPETMSIEKRYVRKDGDVVWAISDASLVRDSEGRPSHFVTHFQDITARKEAEEALKESEARLRAVARGAPVILFALDAEGVFTFESGSGLEELGLEPGASVGRSVFEAYSRFSQVIENVRRALSGEEVTDTVELAGRAYHATYSPQRSDGNVTGVVGVATDVTERRRLEEELAHRALHDPLTGLPNRRLLLERLSRALARRGVAAAVLFVDLDGFKAVNDALGHEAGDEVLVVAGERLLGTVRPQDTVARLGGDEFCVLLDGAGPKDAARVAERIISALGPSFSVGGPDGAHELRISASVGIARGGASGGGGRTDAGPAELLRRADLAMYRAKEGGKGTYAVFDLREDSGALERTRLKGELSRALDRGEFALRYQPVFSLKDGRPVGAEALLRWEHPERGLLAPATFLAAAEEAGLAPAIDDWALGEACRFAAGLDAAASGSGDRSPWVSVNLSPRRLQRPGLVGSVRRVLQENGLKPGRLILEITEDAAAEGDAAEGALRDLRDLGVGLALDDFGSGHSSLSQLERLPVGLVKLDRSFVANLTEDAKQPDVVRGVASIAGALGISVAAEGVETAAQRDALQRAGCELVQGHLFARALPVAEARTVLGEGRP